MRRNDLFELTSNAKYIPLWAFFGVCGGGIAEENNASFSFLQRQDFWCLAIIDSLPSVGCGRKAFPTKSPTGSWVRAEEGDTSLMFFKDWPSTVP